MSSGPICTVRVIVLAGVRQVVDDHVQGSKRSIRTNIGLENFVDCCQVYLSFRKGNPVQARPACHPYGIAGSETIGAHAKHENVPFFAPCNVHIAVRANCENSDIAGILRKLLDLKSGWHMKLRSRRRRELDWLQDVPGDFDIGMMLRGASSGGCLLRVGHSAHRDQNREDEKAHAAFCLQLVCREVT
jgi:hypothetical protein